MTESPQALITGASSGIGRATAELLLARGYRVVGLSRRGTLAAIDDKNFTALAVDLGDLEHLEASLNKLLESHQFDCFIHAAGQGSFGSIEQFSRQQIQTAIDVNLTSAMVICRSLLPGMRRRERGRIIFIGSEAALQGGKKGALYCAAKFGLRGFCQSLREDCAANAIQVSLINPGMVRSAFFDDLNFAPGPQPENAIEVGDLAKIIGQILDSNPAIVIDEINLSPRVKSIEFGKKS